MNSNGGGKPTLGYLPRSLMWAVMAEVIQETLSSSPWNLGIYQKSIPSSQSPSDPTWFDPSLRNMNRGFAKGLPSTEGDVFITTSYNFLFTSNIRLFSRTGTLNLLYNSGWTGHVYTTIKTQGGTTYLISSIKFTDKSPHQGHFIQKLQVSGSTITTAAPAYTDT